LKELPCVPTNDFLISRSHDEQMLFVIVGMKLDAVADLVVGEPVFGEKNVGQFDPV
jgi:hypothetical protein